MFPNQHFGIEVEQNDIDMAPADLDADRVCAFGPQVDGRRRLAAPAAQHFAAGDQAGLLQVGQDGGHRLRCKTGQAGNIGVGDTQVETDDGQYRSLVGAAQTLVLQAATTGIENVAKRLCRRRHFQYPGRRLPAGKMCGRLACRRNR